MDDFIDLGSKSDVRVKQHSKISALGLLFSEILPRLDSLWLGKFCMLNCIISDFELLSWRKFCAIQKLISRRQSLTAARLLGSPGLRGRYICVSSA